MARADVYHESQLSSNQGKQKIVENEATEDENKISILVSISVLTGGGLLIAVGAICYALEISLSLIVVIKAMFLLVIAVLLNEQLLKCSKIIHDYLKPLIIAKQTETVM